MAYHYGIASFSGGVTGVCNDFTVKATPDKKELSGNPASQIVDVRTGKIIETITANVAISTVVEPRTLIGQTVTIEITSEDAGQVSIAGKVVDAELKGSKEDWWIFTITVEYVPTTPTP